MPSAPIWKKSFTEGVKHFRHQDFDEALESLDEAIRLANDGSYALYDTRASVYEKLNCLNEALRDAKKVIDIAPTQWEGYFRSARLLSSLGQSDAALQMCSLALERLGDGAKHESRRRELTDLRRHLEAPTKSLVSSMPVELLLMVFNFSGNPVVISHVCRRWRESALSQPTLWSSLVLTGPLEKAVCKIQEWHKRSRGRVVELSIRKSLAAALLSEDRTMYNDMLAMLQRLDLTELKECHMENMDLESFLFALNGSTTSVHRHLETVSTSFSQPHALYFGRFAYDEQEWKNLRVLSITNERCNWTQLSMSSMRHLTSFEYKIRCHITGFLSFHRFLRANLGLEKLVLEAVTYYPYPLHAPLEPLTLPHLRHLELKGLLPFRIKDGNFSLPSLRILRMTSLKDSALELTGLIEDEGTSFAELVEFTMRPQKRQVLTSVLLRAPKLEILNCTDFDGAVAESLTKPCMALLRDPTSEDPKLVPTKLPILCPALSVLDLSRSPKLKTDPVVQIVKERIALAASQDGGRYRLPGQDGDLAVSCIRALKVDRCPHIEADVYPWFRENVQEFSPRFSCRYDLRRKR